MAENEELSLRERVLQKMDEVAPHIDDGTAATYSIGSFMSEATLQLLLSAPTHLLPIVDFGAAAGDVVPNADGSGVVKLPEGFVKMVELKMSGWGRPVVSFIDKGHPLYSRQFNVHTRGSKSKPVVVVGSGAVEYYSLDAGAIPTIESAKCVVLVAPTAIDAKLQDALCWLTASLILGVKNEVEAAAVARGRYDEIILINSAQTK